MTSDRIRCDDSTVHRRAVIARLLNGCGILGGSSLGADDRCARPGYPRDPLSEQYTASVAMGQHQDGAETWVVVIKNKDTGAEGFRDSYAYSSRLRVGITRPSSSDQLWLLSSDVGPAHVGQRPDGTWVMANIYPETAGDVPEEINALTD